MNNVNLVGRLARDIDLSYSGDLAIGKVSIAVDREKKDSGCDFIPLVFFGKIAENTEKFVGKGNLIAIQGRIQVNAYESKGEKRYSTSVVVDKVQFIEFKKKENKDEVPTFTALEDDIPF